MICPAPCVFIGAMTSAVESSVAGSGSVLDAMEVGGEQPAACRVPLGVGRAGLSQHRAEHDDVARGEPGEQGRLRNASVDDPLHDGVDLGANSSRCGGSGQWSSVQGQDQLIALGDRGLDEQAQAVSIFTKGSWDHHS